MPENSALVAERAAATIGGARDSDWIRNALSKSSMNALRTAIVQLTGDEELAAIPTYRRPVRGGALFVYDILPEYHALIRDRALAYLIDHAGQPTPPPPDESRVRELIGIFAQEELCEQEMLFGIEEVAFDPFPRDAHWNGAVDPAQAKQIKVAIIGAGIGGIAMAVQLKRLGIAHQILEKQDDIGGTWMRNNYPEARVDTSSYLYQFKFVKNYPWSEFFAARDETRRYLNHVVDSYGVRDSFRLSTEVKAVRWNEADAQWVITIRNPDGSEEDIQAQYVVSATGLFNAAKLPDIPGIHDFKGAMFHTTEWDHGCDYSGKRVALIGTGSTGTQLMPAVAKKAASLTIYQRTPEWVMAFEGYKEPISEEVRWLFDNVPYYWNWYSFSAHMTAQCLQDLHELDPEWRAQGGRINARNDSLREALLTYINDKLATRPDLIDKLTPEHAPLTRRLVVDNGFYDTLLHDSVSLETGSIERITEKGIVGEDGIEREYDVIILATGFATSKYLFPIDMTGRDGARLEDLWSEDGARAYLGLALPGFPNFFMFYGPDGQPRSGGYYSWSEVWARYVAQAIILATETGHRSIEVRRDIFDAYNSALDEAANGKIWTETGHGYYVNEFGRSSVNMPWSTREYHSRTRQISSDDYKLK